MDIAKLIYKYLQGSLCESERERLDEWLKDERNKNVFSRLTDKRRIMMKMELLDEYDWQESWKQVERKLYSRKKLRWGHWAIAASFVGVMILGVWMFLEERESVSLALGVEEGIEPGKLCAELVLPGGEIVDLHKDSISLFLLENGNSLKTEEGILSLLPDVGREQKVDYSEVRTPRGGEYQVVLPDGTVVWLNSESRLRFPSAFVGKERKVEVSGELYFQVMKDSLLPFRVEIEGLYEVEVLGTEFNVRAYSDLPSATTLVEGSVLIRDVGSEIRLQPGEQVVEGDDGKGLFVRKVDVASCIAWKQGYFLFENERLEDILNELARWYNVEVFFENSFAREERFSVEIRRHESFEEVLRLISQTKAVRIEVKGNSVFVK